jgi:DNA polymerase
MPFDRILAIDFETAYCSRTYTLRKLTTESYIRDPRFKAWGLSYEEVRLDDALRTENTGGPQWVSRADLQEWVDSIDWSRTAILAQNAMFDGAILSWVYGAKPAFIFDTLSMARAKRGLSVKNSLEQLAIDFSLPPKGNELSMTDGVLDALNPQVEAHIAGYCKHDTWLCVEIFKRLLDGYPVSELRLIDLTLKMFVFPQLLLDSDMLTHAIVKEREQREALLDKLQVTDGILASNDHFAEVLRNMGIEPPMKKKKPTKKTPNRKE